MMMLSMIPPVWGRFPFAIMARPIATPAWGKRESHIYFLILTSALAITDPTNAPPILPDTLSTT